MNASQKGQRGKMSERLVEMNVRWQPNMKTLLRRLTASAGLRRRPSSGSRCCGTLCHVLAFCVRERAELVIGERWARLRRLVLIRAATAGTLSHSDTDSGSPVTLCNGPKWFKCSGFNHPTGFAGLIVSALM